MCVWPATTRRCSTLAQQARRSFSSVVSSVTIVACRRSARRVARRAMPSSTTENGSAGEPVRPARRRAAPAASRPSVARELVVEAGRQLPRMQVRVRQRADELDDLGGCGGPADDVAAEDDRVHALPLDLGEHGLERRQVRRGRRRAPRRATRALLHDLEQRRAGAAGAADARTTVRSARAMRPWRPITLPTSSSATWSCEDGVAVALAPPRPRTASGSSTSRRARYSTSSADSTFALAFSRRCDRGRRLRALRQPVLDLLLVELDRRRVGLRVVAARRSR